MNFPKVSDKITFDMQKKHTRLRKIESVTEASKIIFGVKTLHHLLHIEPETRDALLTFFNGNVSDLVEWAKHCNPGKYERTINGKWKHDYSTLRFNARTEMFAAYKQIAKELGVSFAVAITQSEEGNDVFSAYNFIRENKKVWAKYQKQVVPAFAQFPQNAWQHMIHDFGMQEMKRIEYAANRGKGGKVAVVTLPQPEKAIESVDKFKILIPRNEYEMRKIGNAQNHCVGRKGMGYARRIEQGDIWIAAIYKEELADGICIEIDRDDGKILQAQGRLRRAPTDAEQTVIKKVNKHLTGYQKKYKPYW